MKEILDAAAEVQAEMERQFNEERAEMERNVEEMRVKIREIEEVEEKNGMKNEQLGQALTKIKASIDRFEKTNRQVGNVTESFFLTKKKVKKKNRFKP